MKKKPCYAVFENVVYACFRCLARKKIEKAQAAGKPISGCDFYQLMQKAKGSAG